MLTEIGLDFEWYRCPQGYRIARRGEKFKGLSLRSDFVVPNSKEQEQIRHRSVGGAEMVLKLFLRVKTEGDLLKFIDQHGPMRLDLPYTGIEDSLKDAKLFRKILASKSGGPKKIVEAFDGYPIRHLREGRKKVIWHLSRQGRPDREEWKDEAEQIGALYIVPDRHKGLVPKIEVSTLLGALWWQLCLKLSGATTYRSCRQCGELFEVGPGTGRRADATFCRAQHSVLYHSHKRSKGDR